MGGITQFGERAGQQIIKTVREHARRMINEAPPRARWQQQQPSQTVSTGGVKVYTLAIRGNADGGSIDFSATGTTTVTGSINFDDDENDVKTAIIGADASVLTNGAILRWNVIKIKFSDPSYSIRITANNLTRETNGISPTPELSYCFEPLAGWE